MQNRIFILIIILVSNLLLAQNAGKEIRCEIIIDAPAEKVWLAWATEEGVKSFFAPDCKIELEVDGAYEMYFIPEAEYGSKGGENNTILAFQENKMLSFTWNAPPVLSQVRGQKTHVLISLTELNQNKTQVVLTHDGWGEGDEWDKAFEYFSSAWEFVVLPRLKYSLEVAPIDWKNPPKFETE
jgi:uncharacterized protein YndB with AHSA1/START domain